MNEINEIKLLKEEIKRIKSLLCCKDALFFDNLASFPVEGKVDILYIDKETSTIYIWNGSTYISIGGSTVEFFTGSPPVSGESGIIYVDQDSGAIYVWDGAAMVTGSASLQEDITYAELAAAIGASELIPGLRYRITDYVTIHYMVDGGGSQSISNINTGSTEPLIVTAISSSKLDCVAKSELYPKDIIHYDWNPSNWVTDVYFAAASTIITGFKGVIYFRHDTIQNNKVSFDFRAVKHRRYKHLGVAYNAGTTYGKYGVCTNAGLLYISKSAGNIGNAVSNEAYWLELDLLEDSEYICSTTTTSLPQGDATTYIDYLTFQPLGSSNYSYFRNNTIERFGTYLISNCVFLSAVTQFTEDNSVKTSRGITLGSSARNNSIERGTRIFIGKSGSYNIIAESAQNDIFISKNSYGNKITLATYMWVGSSFSGNVFGTVFVGFIGKSCVGNQVYYFSQSSCKSNFRYNELKSPFIVSAIDFSSATHVYGNYTCVGFRDTGIQDKIFYFDNLGVQQIVSITA